MTHLGKRRPPDLRLRREHEIFFTDLEVSGETLLVERRFDPLGPLLVLGRKTPKADVELARKRFRDLIQERRRK